MSNQLECCCCCFFSLLTIPNKNIERIVFMEHKQHTASMHPFNRIYRLSLMSCTIYINYITFIVFGTRIFNDVEANSINVCTILVIVLVISVALQQKASIEFCYSEGSNTSEFMSMWFLVCLYDVGYFVTSK